LQHEDDYVDTLPAISAAVKKGPRSSVSAEAFGAWNTKKSFVAQKIAKSAETKDELRKKLSMSFMFSNLDEREQEIVIDAM